MSPRQRWRTRAVAAAQELLPDLRDQASVMMPAATAMSCLRRLRLRMNGGRTPVIFSHRQGHDGRSH